MNKREKRKEILQIRDSLDELLRTESSELIKRQLFKQTLFQSLDEVLIYASYKSEVDTFQLMGEMLNLGKKVFCPLVIGKNMEFFEILSLDDLHKGFQGILEPDYNPVKNWFYTHGNATKSLLIMPGVAFDRTGNRIGYGGGYYDRFLHDFGNDLETIALAFEEQIIDDCIVADEFDVKPSMIITNQNVYRINRS